MGLKKPNKGGGIKLLPGIQDVRSTGSSSGLLTTEMKPYGFSFSMNEGMFARTTYTITSGSYAGITLQLYVNDQPKGIARIQATTAPITYTEDIQLQKGDKIQIWAKYNNSAVNMSINSFKLQADLFSLVTIT